MSREETWCAITLFTRNLPLISNSRKKVDGEWKSTNGRETKCYKKWFLHCCHTENAVEVQSEPERITQQDDLWGHTAGTWWEMGVGLSGLLEQVLVPGSSCAGEPDGPSWCFLSLPVFGCLSHNSNNSNESSAESEHVAPRWDIVRRGLHVAECEEDR